MIEEPALRTHESPLCILPTTSSHRPMSSSLYAINPFTVVAFCLLMAGGCNAFEFLHDEDATSDPDILLDDAQLALQNGDAEKAVELLEKALAAAPGNTEIELALSTALFQANDIDVLLLKELADFIAEPDSDAGKVGSTTRYPACSFSEDPQRTTILRFDETAAYLSLFNHLEVLQRVLELLRTAAGVEAGTTLDESAVSNARLMRAIATMAVAVIEIKTQADAAQATIHSLSSGGLGYCAVDQNALRDLESFILCEKLLAIDQAVDDMVYRQQLFGASDNELVQAITNARDEISSTITLSCQAQ